MMLQRCGAVALAVFCTAAVSARAEDEATGSSLSPKARQEVLDFHNKARKDVGVEPLKWSPELAKFAQAWADHLAEEGEFAHRPGDGDWAQKYGENIAINGTVLKGAEAWYAEIKDYKAGDPVPEDFSTFKAGHYTQMVWGRTKSVGVGSAVMKKGPFKGQLVIVANYDPPGNVVGEKPY